MSDFKQVKVDNWGIYFLQRLKHFFNRTDYCDLTLQFQDNAQLKVHRLVLNACTEYFELLERTCEMYEDCLIMPDDLQADVVVPIVNFMYTGQLEFKMDILEKLYQTSQIMNMPVLTKLLDSHRVVRVTPSQKVNTVRRYTKSSEAVKTVKQSPSIASTSTKRSYSKAFSSNNSKYKDQTVYISKPETKPYVYQSPHVLDLPPTPKRSVPVDPRPTRYELPEELDTDNVFDSSFTNISYASQPLMVHPDSVKQYSSKRPGIFNNSRGSKNDRISTLDIVECKKISNNASNIFDDHVADETDIFDNTSVNNESSKVSNQLFDQILDNNDGPKVTIEAKDSKTANNIDHAKIISEVLKKYPHLVKSNKVIKLKVLNSNNKLQSKKQVITPKVKEPIKPKVENEPDFTYEVDVLDSKEAAKLIALGAENVKGPWICLICGTPGKALHFTSYLKFRRHLVDVHNEKPVMNICEYCGMKSAKRNCLLHHLYSKHGVEPPASHHFPKCNQCSYIGLTEALLVRHKLSHVEGRHFRCNVCDEVFTTSNLLLQHIQHTGHKYSAERKTNLQCVYCLKVFLRQTNLYAHLKTNHRKEAMKDGIIDDSEDEAERPKAIDVKYEPNTSISNEYDEVDVQYNIHQRPDGNIQVVAKKQTDTPSKQKILNSDFSLPKPAQKSKPTVSAQNMNNELLQNVNVGAHNTDEEIVTIDNNEYIVRNNLLYPKSNNTQENEESIIPEMLEPAESTIQTVTPNTSMEFTSIHTTTVDGNIPQSNMIFKNSSNLNQPIQIVVSNEEEYKALMSSNHPIIFDNGDASKTLTVLTAPHATSLGTIDINTAQTNDMMIIQEDYPLNVSEAVATDNSNIVVVYSHHINQDNKQYQLLAPDGVSEQFVQSSAIITQNYETITTSTPVVSAHVLDTPVETWQQNDQPVQNQQIQINTESSLESIPKLPQTDNESTDISDLPEVSLKLNSHKCTDEEANTADNNLESNNDMVIQQVQNVRQDHMENVVTSVPMEIDHPTDDTVEKEIDTTQSTAKSGESNLEEGASNVLPEMVVIQSCDVIQPQIDSECNTQQISDEPVVQQQHIVVTNTDFQISIIENSMDVQTTFESVDETNNENYESETTQTISNTDVEPTQEAKAKIQAFTEQWSGNEYETTAPVQQMESVTSQDENMQQSSPKTVIAVDVQTDVEESIENIQQEIEKQMAITNVATPNVNESTTVVTADVDASITVPTPDVDASTTADSPNVDASKTPDTPDVGESTTPVTPDVDETTPITPDVDETTPITPDVDETTTTDTLEVDASTTADTPEIDESINTPKEDNSTISNQKEATVVSLGTNGTVHVVQENISSILNDWDDNDSQEEKESTTDNVEASEASDTPDTRPPETNNAVLETTVAEKSVPKPDVKSLVSDWDDDDEEETKT